MQAEIEAAVAWWVNQLRGLPRQDNGDEFQSLALTLMAGMASPPTDTQLATFGEALRERLPDYLRSEHWDEAVRRGNPDWGNRYVGCDYRPDGVLAEAAAAAGIDTRRFPVKTGMWIDPGEVRVAGGYGAPFETIYPVGDGD